MEEGGVFGEEGLEMGVWRKLMGKKWVNGKRETLWDRVKE